jgi:hypothetical protein
VYPSLYEGFGIPPLEAMACGCPVAASNAGAIPEVCGDAAVLFAPTDVEAMATAMLEADDRREELRERGLARAALYTWDETAHQHEDVYALSSAKSPQVPQRLREAAGAPQREERNVAEEARERGRGTEQEAEGHVRDERHGGDDDRCPHDAAKSRHERAELTEQGREHEERRERQGDCESVELEEIGADPREQDLHGDCSCPDPGQRAQAPCDEGERE